MDGRGPLCRTRTHWLRPRVATAFSVESSLVTRLGAWTRHFPTRVGQGTRAGLLYTRALVTLPGSPRGARAFVVVSLLAQLYFTGVQALPLLVLVGASFATALMAVGYRTLAELGAADSFGALLSTGLAGELGPLLTGLVVAGRSGTAITTELGAMTLRNEIDALRVHGVDPYQQVVAPRLLGVTLATTLLTTALVVSVYVGCALIAPLLGVSLREIATVLLHALTPRDLLRMTLKGLSFGAWTGAVAVYHGLQVSRDPRDLPRAGSRSVMVVIVGVFVLDAVVSVVTLP